METQKGTYAEDQSVIGKMDDGMQKLMKVAKDASDDNAGHKKMHIAWKAVHDVLHALYMKPNPKPNGSPTVTTLNEGAKKAAADVDTLPPSTTAAAAASAEAPATAAAAAPATAAAAAPAEAAKGGGHCDKKSKRRRRKGRKGRRATKKK